MRSEIDLFKTGLFPDIDLFKSGDTSALGYRRVYVTSKREARFAKIDPDSLVPAGFLGITEGLSGMIDFSAAGAQEALAELRASLAEAQRGVDFLDANRIIRLARHYFWELETALQLAILLASRQAALLVPEPPSWERVIQAWRALGPNGDALDEIATLDFEWNGVDLFELRTYAELARTGTLSLQSVVSVQDGKPTGPVLGASLEPPCRKGGQQLFLPEGLDRFMDASRRFVQRLLRLNIMPK
jgi:hypothetical protein